MRSLLIPAGLIAFGLLAALPFRRTVERPAHPPVEAVGLPDTVTPLREAPLATDWSPAATDRSPVPARFASTNRVSAFSSATVPPANPYAPPIGSLSTSYQEVAVPLALPEDPSNLLDATTEMAEHPESLSRFGIPAALLAGEPDAAASQSPEAIGAASRWQAERAIPSLEPASTLTSVLEPQTESKPTAAFQTVSKTELAPPPPESRVRMFIREPQ